MTESLRNALKRLHMSGLLESLEVRLHEAAANNLSAAEFLEIVLHDELAVRADRQLQRRVKAAQFRELKTLEDFDWSFNPSIKKKQVFELATCRFIREARDVLFLGPPGVGKSFLCQAIGYQALKAGFGVLYRSIFDVVRDFLHDEALGGEDKVLAHYLKPDLLIVDDMGMKQLPKRSGEYLFEIIMRRYENACDGDDVEPAAGGLGQTHRRRAERDSDPGPLPAPCRGGADHRQELSPASGQPLRRRRGQCDQSRPSGRRCRGSKIGQALTGSAGSQNRPGAHRLGTLKEVESRGLRACSPC